MAYVGPVGFSREDSNLTVVLPFAIEQYLALKVRLSGRGGLRTLRTAAHRQDDKEQRNRQGNVRIDDVSLRVQAILGRSYSPRPYKGYGRVTNPCCVSGNERHVVYRAPWTVDAVGGVGLYRDSLLAGFHVNAGGVEAPCSTTGKYPGTRSWVLVSYVWKAEPRSHEAHRAPHRQRGRDHPSEKAPLPSRALRAA